MIVDKKFEMFCRLVSVVGNHTTHEPYGCLLGFKLFHVLLILLMGEEEEEEREKNQITDISRLTCPNYRHLLIR